MYIISDWSSRFTTKYFLKKKPFSKMKKYATFYERWLHWNMVLSVLMNSVKKSPGYLQSSEKTFKMQMIIRSVCILGWRLWKTDLRAFLKRGQSMGSSVFYEAKKRNCRSNLEQFQAFKIIYEITVQKLWPR